METCRRSVTGSILAHRICHILSHGTTSCHYTLAIYQMTVLIAVLDIISDLKWIEPQTHFIVLAIHLLQWKLSPLLREAAQYLFLLTLSLLLSLCLQSFHKLTSTKYKQWTQLQCSTAVRLQLCNMSLVPVGNYLSPLVISFRHVTDK